jgi:hypothetical protein
MFIRLLPEVSKLLAVYRITNRTSYREVSSTELSCSHFDRTGNVAVKSQGIQGVRLLALSHDLAS